VERGVTERSPENLFGAFATTFALTISNPVTILAFLGVFAAVGFSGREATLDRAGMLVAGVLAGSLLWWLTLSVVAGIFRSRFREAHLRWMNRISGGILVASGAYLLLSLAFNLGP
jgi:threonine/homoserine/homoserine lactone efflux protein